MMKRGNSDNNSSSGSDLESFGALLRRKNKRAVVDEEDVESLDDADTFSFGTPSGSRRKSRTPLTKIDKSAKKSASRLSSSSSKHTLPVEKQNDTLVGEDDDGDHLTVPTAAESMIVEQRRLSFGGDDELKSKRLSFDDENDYVVDDYDVASEKSEEKMENKVQHQRHKSTNDVRKRTSSVSSSSGSSERSSSSEEDDDEFTPAPKSRKRKDHDNDYYKTTERRPRKIEPVFDPRKDDVTPGVRRSKRRRWLPLEHWRGERLVIQRGPKEDEVALVVGAEKPVNFMTPKPPPKRKKKVKPKQEPGEKPVLIPSKLKILDPDTALSVTDPATGQVCTNIIVRDRRDITLDDLQQDTDVTFRKSQQSNKQVPSKKGPSRCWHLTAHSSSLE